MLILKQIESDVASDAKPSPPSESALERARAARLKKKRKRSHGHHHHCHCRHFHHHRRCCCYHEDHQTHHQKDQPRREPQLWPTPIAAKSGEEKPRRTEVTTPEPEESRRGDRTKEIGASVHRPAQREKALSPAHSRRRRQTASKPALIYRKKGQNLLFLFRVVTNISTNMYTKAKNDPRRRENRAPSSAYDEAMLGALAGRLMLGSARFYTKKSVYARFEDQTRLPRSHQRKARRKRRRRKRRRA